MSEVRQAGDRPEERGDHADAVLKDLLVTGEIMTAEQEDGRGGV
jgi:hypothetical protein